jgi:hypothetical protein
LRLLLDGVAEKAMNMNGKCCDSQVPGPLLGASVQDHVDSIIDEIIDSLPDPKQLSDDDRRGIIARYTAVLEGNFIYWMTGAYISVQSEEAGPILLDNLHEEVRDCHPGMLRRFALAAYALPTDSDALAVHPELMKVRQFVGRLSGVRTVLMMAFFEGFIQNFMRFLDELATYRGSAEREYTEVHGVCDLAHTRELFRALSAEMALSRHEPVREDFEGVYLLRSLILSIVHGVSEPPRIHANGSRSSYGVDAHGARP